MKLLTIATFFVFAPFILIWFFSELIKSIKITPNKRLVNPVLGDGIAAKRGDKK